MPLDLPFSVIDDLVTEIVGDCMQPVLLLTDFDGTLREFQTDPVTVFLPGKCRTALSTLTGRRNLSVGIVSGRRAADVRLRTAFFGPAYYPGFHGMEIDGPDIGFEVPQLATRRTLLQKVANSIASTITSLSGVFLENKDLSVALHFRVALRPIGNEPNVRSGW